MSLRTRLLLAFAAVVFVPIAILAFGVRQTMANRLSEEYERRLATVLEVITEDLQLESAGIGERLASLRTALENDNGFRRAVAGVEAERSYLIDYAGTAMRLTGLSMLQIQDGEGRIVSSGHFRNEHGGLEPSLAETVDAARQTKAGVVLVLAHAADGDFVALARAESLRIGDRAFTLVGGAAVDETFLRRLAREQAIDVSLIHPGGRLSSAAPAAQGEDRFSETGSGSDVAVGELSIPLIRPSASAPPEVIQATLRVRQPLVPLQTLLQNADSWFLTTAVGTGIAALLLAVWVSSRISRPLADLAEKTAVLDLDRLDVEFDEDRKDEVGTLSRLLGDLASRLRASTTRVRQAERRATVGDLARQINHDIKNGLIPLRNVIRHLEQVGEDQPDALPAVLAERRRTVDSSIAYLETLATNYERLSSTPDRRDCDLNAVIAELARGARGREVDLRTELAPALPLVVGDPVALRRILENLTANAVDSLGGRSGRITISTALIAGDTDAPAIRVTVADTGCGMSREEAARIFNDFYTTKAGGTGLGLSIVRRLVMDLRGTIRVESEPGTGTRMIVELPTEARPRA
jgi:signal transduction histidine kinase